jgi:hypothetical protein
MYICHRHVLLLTSSLTCQIVTMFELTCGYPKKPLVHRRMWKPNATLIARKCAVSRMAGSRVLRNEPDVSPATRELVLRMAEKMGFRPSGCYHLDQRSSSKSYAILFQPECAYGVLSGK